MLLYPETETGDESFGIYHQGHDDGHYYKLAFVSIFDTDAKIDEHLGEKILAKLNVH